MNLLDLPAEMCFHIYSFTSNPVFSLVNKKNWGICRPGQLSMIDAVKWILKDREFFAKKLAKLQEQPLSMTNSQRAKWIKNIADIIFCAKSLDQVLKITSSVFFIEPKTWRKVEYFVEARMKLEKIQAKKSTRSDHDYELCEFFNEWSTFPEQFYLQMEIAKLCEINHLREGSMNKAIYCALKCDIYFLELVCAAETYISDPNERDDCLIGLIPCYISKKKYVEAFYIADRITNPSQRKFEKAIITELSKTDIRVRSLKKT